jgi:hypothetical protein
MSSPNAFLSPPDSATLSTTLARDWAFQVNTGTREAPVWIWVNGLSTFAPQTDQTMQDDGDIHGKGGKSQIPTAIGFNITATGLRKGEGEATDSDYVPDEGQEYLRAKGEKLGSANFANIRYWRTDGNPESKMGIIAVNWTPGSDDKEGLNTFTLAGTGRGFPTDIPKPEPEVIP